MLQPALRRAAPRIVASALCRGRFSSAPRAVEELGRPLPLDEHAVSVSMPKWQHVVGYEEGDASVHDKLACGYPRFVYHPGVTRLSEAILERRGLLGKGAQCAVMPHGAAAERLAAFLSVHCDASLVRTVAEAGVHAVLYPEHLAPEAKSFWQHTGELVSSRQAIASLSAISCQPSVGPITSQFCEEGRIHCAVDETRDAARAAAYESCAFDSLRTQIGALTGQARDDVYLEPCGMGAVSLGLRLARSLRPNGAAVVFGFPYLDTLKLCNRRELCPGGAHFFPRGDAADLAELEALLRTAPRDICAVFTEFPSNPLLNTPDLERLSSACRSAGVPLIVDDTIATFQNVDLMGAGGADLLASSLTKLFSGRGDVMGGSLVINGASRLYDGLKGAAEANRLSMGDWQGLFPADAVALYLNSRDFVQRSKAINSTTQQLAEWLQAQPGVARVHYPGLHPGGGVDPLYGKYLKADGGSGSLFSVIFREDRVCAETFYDALQVSKGPSLGTNFTLCCPYTILAHYDELDWAKACGVDPNLVRVSVGLDGIDKLKAAFEEALLLATKR